MYYETNTQRIYISIYPHQVWKFFESLSHKKKKHKEREAFARVSALSEWLSITSLRKHSSTPLFLRLSSEG